MPQRLKRGLRDLGTVALSLFSLMVLGWLTDGLNGTPILPDLFSNWWPEPYEREAVGPHAEGSGFWLWLLPTLTLGLLLLVSSAFTLGRLRRPLVQEVAPPQEVRPRRVLVAMLSTLDTKPLQALRQELESLPDDQSGLDSLLLCLKKHERWSGEPLLRGVQAHIPCLERLYLLTTPGSKAGYEPLKALLGELLPYLRINGCPVKDGNDLHRIYRTLTRLEKELEHEGIPGDEIVIDATGGPKPYSMAAAFATLHNELSLQYVYPDSEKGAWCVQEFGVEASRPSR
ncbi:hypothetical protein [Azotobacter vinelandii]|uniref:hypothetical protein n=1 Tax=Azotobacter vinelandii TaxID=354 RepID=UPI0026651646|nr:hypothetical protein [Azotobacter vinelandii]WKN24003.1 hypothetical protein AVAEIV_002141 [Azotobacter vinelandii]